MKYLYYEIFTATYLRNKTEKKNSLHHSPREICLKPSFKFKTSLLLVPKGISRKMKTRANEKIHTQPVSLGEGLSGNSSRTFTPDPSELAERRGESGAVVARAFRMRTRAHVRDREKERESETKREQE